MSNTQHAGTGVPPHSALQGMGLRELNTVIRDVVGDDAVPYRSKSEAIDCIEQVRRRQARTRIPTEGTLRAFAEDQLKSGPLTYSQVLARVKAQFPQCHTSRSSLRWYASQIRARGEELPERPIDSPQ